MQNQEDHKRGSENRKLNAIKQYLDITGIFILKIVLPLTVIIYLIFYIKQEKLITQFKQNQENLEAHFNLLSNRFELFKKGAEINIENNRIMNLCNQAIHDKNRMTSTFALNSVVALNNEELKDDLLSLLAEYDSNSLIRIRASQHLSVSKSIKLFPNFEIILNYPSDHPDSSYQTKVIQSTLLEFGQGYVTGYGSGLKITQRPQSTVEMIKNSKFDKSKDFIISYNPTNQLVITRTLLAYLVQNNPGYRFHLNPISANDYEMAGKILITFPINN